MVVAEVDWIGGGGGGCSAVPAVIKLNEYVCPCVYICVCIIVTIRQVLDLGVFKDGRPCQPAYRTKIQPVFVCVCVCV